MTPSYYATSPIWLFTTPVSDYLNQQYKFMEKTCTWTKYLLIPSRPGRSCPSWATHNGSVYLFGGYDGGVLNSPEVLEMWRFPQRSRWAWWFSICGKSMNILEMFVQWKMWNIIPTWSNRYQNHGLKLRWGIDGNHVEIAVDACDLGVSMIADWAWWDEHVRSLTKQTVGVLNAKPSSCNQWIYGIDIGNLFQ